MNVKKIISKVISEVLNGDRELGAPLSSKTNSQYATVYRAVGNDVDVFFDRDFVTLSKKFAIEHAESNHIVYEEQQQVIVALISTDNIYEATNPGEYLYSGPNKKGKVIYLTKGYEYEGWDDSLL